MYALRSKFKEVLLAVVPVMGIMLLLHFTITPMAPGLAGKFVLGGFLAILGLTAFLFGIDQSVEPIGHGIGGVIVRRGRLSLVVAVGLMLGFFISFAEPDLHILAGQVAEVTGGRLPSLVIVSVVSVGIALLMTLGLLRIFRSFSLRVSLLLAYGAIFALALVSSSDFLAIAFDASGATTGALTTPFILAMAAGVPALKRGRASESDSFGLVGLSSTGAILGVLAAGLLMGVDKMQGEAPALHEAARVGALAAFGQTLPGVAKDTLISLLPILLFYLFFQTFFLHQPRRSVRSILKGLAMCDLGLVLFLTGVHGGFMEAGRSMGMALSAAPSRAPLLLVSFLLGLVTVLAEPATIVLTHQIEEITGGSVPRPLVLLFMSVAVGLSILMAVLRVIVPGIELWMFLLAGFGGAILMSFFTPDLFVGMAFDAGGVASGPMTATFSLAFVQGVALQTPHADIVADGFGMIAIVAMMPILAVQTLGILYRVKTRKTHRRRSHAGA